MVQSPKFIDGDKENYSFFQAHDFIPFRFICATNLALAPPFLSYPLPASFLTIAKLLW
jgi:hypothetical protein